MSVNVKWGTGEYTTTPLNYTEAKIDGERHTFLEGGACTISSVTVRGENTTTGNIDFEQEVPFPGRWP